MITTPGQPSTQVQNRGGGTASLKVAIPPGGGDSCIKMPGCVVGGLKMYPF